MKELLDLARNAICCKLKGKKLEIPDKVKKFSEKRASFVTLTLNGELRGCIGTLYPIRELWKDVVYNAECAAFKDPRFFPLTEEELKKTKIEISILSYPKKIEFKDEKDLLKKINKNFGLILKKDFHIATFLPQVWEQIPDKIKFLENLSIKAGLNKDSWKNSELWCYKVKKIKEDNL